MNISYNWLKDYANFNLTPDEVSRALTSIGLEVGTVEEVESIRGGLRGIVIGKVLTCVPHPDRLLRNVWCHPQKIPDNPDW